MYEQILYDVDDPVATITLNRPDSLNAWTDVMGNEFNDAIDRAAADTRVVAIVVTGAGRAFCAGADMGLLSGISSGAGSGLVEPPSSKPPEGDFGGRFPRLMTIDKPIIAAVNGAVAGMAFPMALACDLRFVSPNAAFITAFSQRGLIAEWGLSWLLPKLVGPAVALDLLWSSRKVGGEEALRLGLANQLVPADDLLDHTRAYVEQLARTGSPLSFAIMKRQVYQHYHRGLGAADAEAFQLMRESFGRPDLAEGVSSFLEKRPPVFARMPRNDA